jgi:hypothetical protein
MMKTTNRLIKEKSPYLLQHSHNPVDWFPWGKEAFEKAKMEDKPVFLSIGYSTCHWCHVMEKESFENEEVAELMNQTFISIKVDREERPDIDGVYMTVCQLFTGSGGWPLTIVMTPDKKPFFAGTYFPGHDKYGRIGMMTLIPRINELWRNKRIDVLRTSDEIAKALHLSSHIVPGNEPGEEIFHKAFEEFKKRYDPEFGGFGNAPKFPTPHNLIFLLRYWKKYNVLDALEMVENTLTKMRLGGIYDQIGYGFHRYSTDKEWLVPHFEKMLYDQALLVPLYLETYQATGNIFYLDTAEEILTYVMRDMTSEEGGFYSAEDADSEGVEGKFYLWSEKEILSVDNIEGQFALDYYNVIRDGNWTDPHSGQSDKSNILHLNKTPELLSAKINLPLSDINEKLKIVRNKLFQSREKRVYPFKDNKILTDWNGLMISAFAKAAQVTGKEKYILFAKSAADFLLAKLIDVNGNLQHRYRESEAAVKANLNDYSFLIQALLDLYETTFSVDYLTKAKELLDVCINKFRDKEDGSFFFSPIADNELIVNQKEIYDGAIPSGNSVMFLNLLRMAKMTGDQDYQGKSLMLLRAFSDTIKISPSAYTQTLTGLDFLIGPSYEIVVSAHDYDYNAVQMINEIRKIYIPNKIIFLKTDSNNLEKLSDYIKEQKPVDGKTAVYICRNFTCDLPLTDPELLKNVLR